MQKLDYQSLKTQFDEQGFLVVEKLFDDALLTRMRSETAGFVNQVSDEGRVDPLLDIIEDSDGVPQLRRITSPEAFADIYDEAMRYEPLLDLVECLLGGTVRFDHGKLNFKPPSGGGAVEWHQDWAFYPQTNDDMLAVGVMLEDCTLENGPLMVVPGSHRGPIYDHHQDGKFVGGIDNRQLDGVLEQAAPLTAPAGSVSIHHVRMLHGSSVNRSDRNRPLLLFNYVAVDAFPIFHSYEWEEFDGRILRGEPTSVPRVAQVPMRIPQPVPKTDDTFSTGSLFDLQSGMTGAIYAEEDSKKAVT